MNELIDFLKPYTTMIQVIFSLILIIFILFLYCVVVWIIDKKYDSEKEKEKRREENIRRITREEIWKREEDWRHVLDEEGQKTT